MVWTTAVRFRAGPPHEASASAAPITRIGGSILPFVKDIALVEVADQLLGVGLVLLEELQTRLQQALEFGVLSRGDERLRQSAVDRLVVGDLVGSVGLVEGPTAQFGQR